MLCFPNAKINLGLYVTEKRSDGFHNLQSLMIPTGPFDMLEFIKADKDQLTISGKTEMIPEENNILFKVLRLLRKKYKVPQVKIHLHKNIPTGAGLGGGSSNAAFFIKNLNSFFRLGMKNEEMKDYASALGSDCAFFIDNKPSFAFGRGEILEYAELETRFHLRLYNPQIHISTAEAFSEITPQVPEKDIRELIKTDIHQWKNVLRNDFEKGLFRKHPRIGFIKQELYNAGAAYASMSGSGSSVYGLFTEKYPLPDSLVSMLIWEGMVPF